MSTVKLTLTYEKDVIEEDIQEIQEAVEDWDDQYIFEFFEIGLEVPTEAILEVIE